MTPTAKIRRIGILTGGGDCPGLNAVIRAVTKTALNDHGLQVMGIQDSYWGLVSGEIRPLHNHDVSGILTQGGTILGPSRLDSFKEGHPPIVAGRSLGTCFGGEPAAKSGGLAR